MAVLGSPFHIFPHQHPQQKERIFLPWKANVSMILSYTNFSSKVFTSLLVLLKFLTSSRPSSIKESRMPVSLSHLNTFSAHTVLTLLTDTFTLICGRGLWHLFYILSIDCNSFEGRFHVAHINHLLDTNWLNWFPNLYAWKTQIKAWYTLLLFHFG